MVDSRFLISSLSLVASAVTFAPACWIWLIKNLESTIEKCEEDKNTKDSQIRTLRDEIAHQEDMIVKLGKEGR